MVVAAAGPALPAAMGQDGADYPRRAGAHPVTDAHADPPIVAFDGGALSVVAQHARLDAVVTRVAAVAQIALTLDAPLPERVTLSIEALPLREAIARLLRSHGYVLTLVPRAESHAAPFGALRVFASTAANVVAETPPQIIAAAAQAGAAALPVPSAPDTDDDDVGVAALAIALGDNARAVRREAAYALGEIGDATSIDLLELALGDPEPQVRIEAVDALAAAGGERAAAALALAQRDPDPAVRETAAYALGQIGGATAARLLRTAAADPDALVREAAEEMLEVVGHD